MSKINKFWVVTKPSKNSELADILFNSDIKGMQNQFLGGLTKSEIVGIYSTKTEAEKIARKLLAKR
jgi:hypothetical protein